jgi:hypothetical protein
MLSPKELEACAEEIIKIIYTYKGITKSSLKINLELSYKLSDNLIASQLDFIIEELLKTKKLNVIEYILPNDLDSINEFLVPIHTQINIRN